MIATHKTPIIYQLSNVAATFAHSAALLYNLPIVLSTDSYFQKALSIVQASLGSIMIMVSLYNYNFQKRVRKLSQERSLLIINYLIKMNCAFLLIFCILGFIISHLITQDQDNSSSLASFMALMSIVIVLDFGNTILLIHQLLKIKNRLNRLSQLSNPSIDEMELYSQVAQSLFDEVKHQKSTPNKDCLLTISNSQDRNQTYEGNSNRNKKNQKLINRQL